MTKNRDEMPMGLIQRSPSWKTHSKWLRRLGFIKNFHGRNPRKCYGVGFHGDIPQEGDGNRPGVDLNPSRRIAAGSFGGLSSNQTYCLDYAEFPIRSERSNVRYSRHGLAWIGSAVDVHASSASPKNLQSLIREAPVRVNHWIDEGTIIETKHPFTYGDWIPEHILSIARSPNFPRPLVLPKFLKERSYVIEELSAAGIDFMFPTDALGMRRATILHKAHHFNLLLNEDVFRIRDLFEISNVIPEPGKIIYLSRRGVRSSNSMSPRNYNSDRVESLIECLGGTVLRTNHMSARDYADVSGLADIVVADHGAAIYNIIRWRPRALIELVTKDWWSNCFCFLSSACGLRYHGIADVSDISGYELQKKIMAHLEFANLFPERDHIFEAPFESYLSAQKSMLSERV